MAAKLEVIKNLGDIDQTDTIEPEVGSDFFEFLQAITLSGTTSLASPLGFNLDAAFDLEQALGLTARAEFIGDSITFDDVGNAITGTINSIALFFGGEESVTLTGLSFSLDDLTIGVGEIGGLADAFGNGEAINFFGGDGQDIFTGTSSSDRIFARGGDDTINAREGRDFIKGGDGNDVIRSGTGNDTVAGGAGNDNIQLSGGDDIAVGGAGQDRIGGGKGNDSIHGGAGFDVLSGRSGDDLLVGGESTDILVGGTGADILLGGIGADFMLGGAGNDTFTGGAGADSFNFRNNQDSNVVTDFEVGVDFIVARALNTGTFQDILDSAIERSDGVILTVGENTTVLLENIAKDQLLETDFGAFSLV